MVVYLDYENLVVVLSMFFLSWKRFLLGRIGHRLWINLSRFMLLRGWI